MLKRWWGQNRRRPAMESLGTGAREGVQTFKVIKKSLARKFLPARLLIYRVNCQWKFIGDCWGSDYLPSLLEEAAFFVGVASFSVGVTCSLCSDGCSEAEAVSL